ncbi:hypothetical protein BDW42DRAFT_162293 [Aspergillus taichungensis]|uniref:GPI transamidase component PIG-S n=1 Tax=Aspergillus taichungensis TaxID=482145 RepID=A0A2J5I3W0_9EURO|nr:hypothetical protein BDW42DRAFT_162293 [Aspergillus taichungensis]
MVRLSSPNAWRATSAVYLLLATLSGTASSSPTGHLLAREAESCPKNYTKCSNDELPSSFCCPSSSTCVSLDNGSSAICCPKGETCEFIQPTGCDVRQQDVKEHPQSHIKTTRTDDRLPKCGDSCCPFGYTCQKDNVCVMDKAKSSSSKTKTNTASETTTNTNTNTNTNTQTATTSSSHTVPIMDPTATAETPDPSITSPSNPNSSAAQAASQLSAACPSYPSQAVAAGFFPGAIFGAIATLLTLFGIRKYKVSHLPPGDKIAQHTQRSSSGTLLGISAPIPSDETSYRTDFLLHRPAAGTARRNSEGARSMLQRSRSRVKSLFGATPKITVSGPDAPPMPVPVPVTPQRVVARRPSTESIKVYTPPGVFAGTSVLKPHAYPDVRPNTTFSDMIDRVGFKDGQGDPCYRVQTPPGPSGGGSGRTGRAARR